MLPNVTAIPGGSRLEGRRDDFIGGVGVSGSPGVDDPCVQAGLDKVADQLQLKFWARSGCSGQTAKILR